jgi:peptide-N4-(N-acetyl-beta-glucosaminyl)asparagine amidase
VLTDDADLSKLGITPGMFVMMNEKAVERNETPAAAVQPNQPYNPYLHKEGQDMLGRLNSNIAHVRMYEDLELQKKALQLIPLDTLKQRAKERDTPLGPQDRLLKELLQWFKRDFFTWVNQPKCGACGADTAPASQAYHSANPNAQRPTPEEVAGMAGRVEIYECKTCACITRFPRYNHPGKLLESRQGRCGEWANCFTLCCRAIGFDARYILDFTDHVWTEVYSSDQKRWLHCDSCENTLDAPMTYESGWGKKLTYVLAFSIEEVVDVTRR